jgi:photosystem II stability/assembly factor-like uncharacterized protein
VCWRVLRLTILIWTIFNIPTLAVAQREEEEEKLMKESPAERARFRRMQRADEKGEIPFNALAKAKSQLNLIRAKGNSRTPDDGGIWNWEWLGPGNIGGRIRTILVHPTNTNTMWIGSVSGGIWRTDNGGSSWAPVADFMADLAVTSLVMDPTNSNNMYASTGEGFLNDVGAENAVGNPGAGIFKSIDGGITWFQLPSTNDGRFMWVNRLAHDPSNANILLAATSEDSTLPNGFHLFIGKIWRTTDGGTSWVTTLTTPVGIRGCTDVKFSPSDPNIALVGATGALYLSQDGGLHWTLQTDGTSGKSRYIPRDDGKSLSASGSLTLNYMEQARSEIDE